MEIKIQSIGIISSPYKIQEGTPTQGCYSEETSFITVFDEFKVGLEGLEVNKYFIVLYWQDRAERDKLKVIPHGKSDKRGCFFHKSSCKTQSYRFLYS